MAPSEGADAGSIPAERNNETEKPALLQVFSRIVDRSDVPPGGGTARSGVEEILERRRKNYPRPLFPHIKRTLARFVLQNLALLAHRIYKPILLGLPFRQSFIDR